MISLLISKFRSWIWGSEGSFSRRVFLVWMSRKASVGMLQDMSLGTWPDGMVYLPALKIMSRSSRSA